MRGVQVWLGVLISGFAATGLGAAERVTVIIQTELGVIEVEVDPEAAPITAANFLKYVDAEHYDGGQFHRTVTMQNQPDDDVKIEVIQASVNREMTDEGFPAIPLERTTQTRLLHKDGAVSMARDAPDSATSSFFFCIGDQPELDFGGKRNPDGQGFAAFGMVTKGREVIKAIQTSPAEAQTLKPPITILSIKRK